jgi:hypothetical protein
LSVSMARVSEKKDYNETIVEESTKG